jgi:hypothetical protein
MDLRSIRPTFLPRDARDSKHRAASHVGLEPLEARQLLSAGCVPLGIGSPDLGVSDAGRSSVVSGLLTPRADGGIQFGKDSASGKTKLTFKDADGTRVRFSLKGQGVGTLTPLGGSGDGNGATSYGLAFTGTDAKTRVTVKVNRNGDGEAFLNGVTADGTLRSIVARNVNLDGDATINGSIRQFVVDDVGEEAPGQRTITISGNGATPSDAVSMKFDGIFDGTIVSQIPVKSLVATAWFDFDTVGTPHDSLTAPSLGTLNMKGTADERGRLNADITLTDSNAVVRSIRAKDLVDNAAIRTAGDIKSFKTGAMLSASVFAGVLDAAPSGSLPDATQIGAKAIGKFTVTGESFDPNNDLGGQRFIDSNVAAATIKKIRVTDVDVASGADAFGFAGLTVKNYKRDAVKLTKAELATPGDHDVQTNYVLRVLAV